MAGGRVLESAAAVNASEEPLVLAVNASEEPLVLVVKEGQRRA